MIKTISYAAKAISSRGVGFLFTYFKESFWFDLQHGTNTNARVTKDDQNISGTGVEQKEGLLYVASFTSVIKKSLAVAHKSIAKDNISNTQFIDLGCGKGKALLVQSLTYPNTHSATSIGIEYDSELVNQATENVERCKLQDKIKIIHDSAINVLNHADQKMLIIYLYNSFQGETLHATLDVLRDTPHILIYVDPAERQMLSQFDYDIVHDVTGKYNADTWLVAHSHAFLKSSHRG